MVEAAERNDADKYSILNEINVKLKVVVLALNCELMSSSFKKVLDIDLNCVSIAGLVQVEGIGPKSARFFVMHSRRNQRIATLDVHILKWLRSMGINAPRQTPQNEVTYKKLENRFLELADERGKTPAELDLEIWKKNQKKVLTKAGG